jgi:hypothetical protein
MKRFRSSRCVREPSPVDTEFSRYMATVDNRNRPQKRTTLFKAGNCLPRGVICVVRRKEAIFNYGRC